MVKRGLFSRIAGDAAPVDAVASIVAHTRALLNSRLGDAVCSPGLGVADFADLVHAFPGGIDQLARSMRATLLEHEPRLRAVSVRHIPGDDLLVLRFEIAAQLASKTMKTLRMTTTVRPGGRVDLTT
jgi:type VI secretion system protein